MILSKRLTMVADLVKKSDTVADIGTDHGYIPIFLYQKGMIKQGLALDIKEGPLKKAQENIIANHVEHAITTRLGAGLEPLSSGEVETVVIAGMGGMLMIEILKDSIEKVLKLDALVLQPQLDADQVRRYVHSIGFQIEEERLVWEEEKFYPIFRISPSLEKYEKEEEYLFGKILIERKDPELKRYLLFSMKKQKSLMDMLSEKNTSSAYIRKEEIKKEHQIYEEVLRCF